MRFQQNTPLSSLFQRCQITLLQPQVGLLIWQLSQWSYHLGSTMLDLLKCVYILLQICGPCLYAVLQMWSYCLPCRLVLLCQFPCCWWFFWVELERGLPSSLPQWPVCFHSLLRVPSLPSLSPLVLVPSWWWRNAKRAWLSWNAAVFWLEGDLNNVAVSPVYALWYLTMCDGHVSQFLIIILSTI